MPGVIEGCQRVLSPVQARADDGFVDEQAPDLGPLREAAEAAEPAEAASGLTDNSGGPLPARDSLRRLLERSPPPKRSSAGWAGIFPAIRASPWLPVFGGILRAILSAGLTGPLRWRSAQR
jgi:hypothetical protein